MHLLLFWNVLLIRVLKSQTNVPTDSSRHVGTDSWFESYDS